LSVAISGSQPLCRWTFDPGTLDPEDAQRLARGFEVFLASLASDPSQLVMAAPLITAQERQALISNRDKAACPYDHSTLVHKMFERQAEQIPDQVALAFESEQLTYRELNSRANQMARHLNTLGVGPETLVGICMDRSPEMVITMLGVLKAGGAYLPLDPSYPSARLALVVEDSRVRVICTQRRLSSLVSPLAESVICVDTDWATIATQPANNLVARLEASSLAYVIYTSGSTGKPKGVMVTHRNVANFFVGMDQKLGRSSPGVWLAVTSISFDISVLELLWTLARGFKVVLSTGKEGALNSFRATPSAALRRKLDFSLFYWDLAAKQGTKGVENYRLLFETAKFADDNGFTALWTPERHFHAFGGLYPNPSVVSAALAARTERIRIRAGSLVLPLHHPIRVVEDWALVDNLSQGRVGLAVAAGWHSNDFVLAPQHYTDRKKILFQSLETIRKLWRGESVEFLGPKGEKLSIQTLPRPVQPELPIWLSAAGNLETYRLAGEIGANILTHLLGQTLEELREKLEVYRAAWNANGHNPGSGHVTLMLHTFIGEDDPYARELVRQPLKAYLQSALTLVGKNAWSFPTTGQVSSTSANEIDRAVDALGPAEMEAMLDHAFERYYANSGLLGTPDACAEMIERLRAIGVDEVGCLIDFGLAFEPVMESLAHLNTLRCATNPSTLTTPAESDYSIAALLKRHQVTHFQCTPSFMRCLMADESTAKALSSVGTLLLGGEPLQTSLYSQLRMSLSGQILNMYGPTETTVWSTCANLNDPGDCITIGRPLANTHVFILDAHLQPVPTGLPGEVFIGGDGVARGYLYRPELTAEKFLTDPFATDASSRLYRTGDLARYLPDGRLEFLGRVDHQVKIRGCRVELGEIEALLARCPGVSEAVAVVREESPGDHRIAAYLVPHPAQTLSIRDIRTSLQENLPECMMPSAFVVLSAFPLTPNRKIDRKALPAPDPDRPQSESSFEAPANSIEEALAEIWAQALHIERVGRNDNFFELGGHSLSAIQITFRIRQTCDVELPLQTFFRMPTLAALAEAIQNLLLEQATNENLEQLAD
jgi:natural product biosynthesis luciferase-like monooxygenase protein